MSVSPTTNSSVFGQPAIVPPAGQRKPRTLLTVDPQSEKKVLVDEDLNRLREFTELIEPDRGYFDNKRERFPAMLKEHQPEVLITSWGSPFLDHEVYRQVPSLKLLVHCAGTIRHLVGRQSIADGLLVTNWGDTVAPYVAEGAMMLTLAGLRRLWSLQKHIHVDGQFYGAKDKGESLFRQSVGLYGYGRIGQEYRKMLQPFHCRVLVFDPYIKDETCEADEVQRVHDLPTLFRESDIVAIHAGKTDETIGSVDAHVLSCLRDDGLIVNTARGALIDYDALCTECVSGRIHAALDVFDPNEPLPKESPLRGLSNVTLTPHVGGPTNNRRGEMGRTAVNNVMRYIMGEPLKFVIDAEQYDRQT